MRRKNWLFAFLFTAVNAGMLGMEKISVPLPLERYASMRDNCPFAVATPVATPAPSQPSFAANWYVSGIGRVDDTDFVGIKARDLSTQFTLYGREPDAQNGVSLVSIEWIEGIGKSTVTIKKGTEIAKLEFNEAVVHGPPQVPTAQTMAPNGKTQAVVVAPPSTSVMKAAPGNGGYPQPQGAKMPTVGITVPTTVPGRSLPLPKQPPQAPNAAPKPVAPYPRRQFGPLNQPSR